MDFVLHPDLEKDSVFITDLPFCQVRLENVRTFPWLLLIPRIADKRSLHDLDQEQLCQLMRESDLCNQALQQVFGPMHINVGALGNVVPQLHWHLVGRSAQDAAWPKPVWGFADTHPWTAAESEHWCSQIKQAISTLA